MFDVYLKAGVLDFEQKFMKSIHFYFILPVYKPSLSPFRIILSAHLFITFMHISLYFAKKQHFRLLPSIVNCYDGNQS